MRVTQLFKIYFPDNGGGIAAVMETVASFFDAENQEIVVCHEKAGKRTSDDVYGGVRIHRCRHYGFQPSPVSLEFLHDAVKRMCESDLTIYHYPYPFADLAILLSEKAGRKRRKRNAIRSGRKLIVWWHCDIKKVLRPFYHPVVRHTLEVADIIIVSSENNLRMAPMLWAYRKKCRAVPFCVSDGCLERGMQSMEKENGKEQGGPDGDREIHNGPATGKHSCGGKRISILFVGRLVWYKGVDVLLRAYAEMAYQNKELIILGGGPMRKEWERLAKELSLENVRFAGSVTEKEKWEAISQCDFLVLPSTTEAEAFGLVQIEAMAFGKPVINTALKSGVPEVSHDGETGITVPPKDMDALAEAMDRLAYDGELREKYGRRARKTVERKYTVEQMKERFFSVLEDASINMDGTGNASGPHAR